jgi:ubiquinone/menaquinone biosynthesis C-methylase UbiE
MQAQLAGSAKEFDDQWRRIQPSQRYHFKKGKPENQMHFAFQNHWRVFRHVLGDMPCGAALEVGCGRGSMGAFFADAGFQVHLLDSSLAALYHARSNLHFDELKGSYLCGNALSLPYCANSFDVVLSIGLLEHFEEIRSPLQEQIRVLRPGGYFLGYVVPERFLSVQSLAMPVNLVLKLAHCLSEGNAGDNWASRSTGKLPLYRNKLKSSDYLRVLRGIGVSNCGSFGMFPVPLISHSPAFPFSLMAPSMERGLTAIWRAVLWLRHKLTGNDPWTCKERWGLAFLVWAKKEEEPKDEL